MYFWQLCIIHFLTWSKSKIISQCAVHWQRAVIVSRMLCQRCSAAHNPSLYVPPIFHSESYLHTCTFLISCHFVHLLGNETTPLFGQLAHLISCYTQMPHFSLFSKPPPLRITPTHCNYIWLYFILRNISTLERCNCHLIV